MAIEKQYGEQTLLCDGCGDDLGEFFDPEEFNRMLALAKQQGWTIRPDGDGGWEHNCGCTGETPLERAQRLLS